MGFNGTSWVAVGALVALAACGSGGKGAAGNGGGGAPEEVVTGQISAALTRASSCDDLLAKIQSDVAAKITLQAELMRQEPQSNSGVTGVLTPGGGVAFDNVARGPASSAAAPPPPAAGAPGVATPGTTPSAGASGSADSAASGSGNAAQQPVTNPGANLPTLGPSGHSDTNVQVKGVDEADIVKTDGSHIWLLHGNELFVLASWPADQTAITGMIPIEGYAQEMFVKDGTAVVFSNVYDQGDLADEPKPDASADAGAAKSSGFNPALYPYYGSPFTKITLVDVGADKPKVTRELFVEGNYLSSRRYDSTVRAVIQGGFRTPQIYAASIDYSDPWGHKYPQDQVDEQVNAWRDRMIAAVMGTTLTDWLPVERELKDGTLSAPNRRCTDFYAPSPGLSDYGLTNIVSFDMQDPKSALGGAIVLGNADEVYSNDSVMLLASRDYRWDAGLIQRERTVLHRFELKGPDTSYSASGFVPGHILDQFSLDEKDGVIRVATTARLWQNFVPPLPALAENAAKQDDLKDANGIATLQRQTDNRVVTLRTDGHDLVRAGITEPLGADGETLKSSRFVGDRGYVVTFHQTDPLMVIDLSNPEKLTKLGELDIPGFSDYMHPIDDNNLLTIGRDTDASGVDRGLMLQLFDVSDPTAPRRTHSFKFGPSGYSEANQNHKAFTFYKPEGAVGYDGLLAFPYVDYGYPFQSSLEVFQVSVSDGFKQLGEIDHTQLLANLCGLVNAGTGPNGTPAYYFNQCVQPEVQRGLFVTGADGSDFVYSVSNGGVVVDALEDLMTPVATVPMGIPDYSDHRVCYAAADVCAGYGGGLVGPTPSGVGGVGIATPGTATTPMVAPPVQTEPAQPPVEDAGVATPTDGGMAMMGTAGAGAGL